MPSFKNTATGLERVGSLVAENHPDLVVSRRRLRRAEQIQLVRERLDSGEQSVGFGARPFVFCGLPVRRPRSGQLLYERRNGHFVLQVTGHPKYGLPWGQDRLVPIFLATLAARQQRQTITFRSAAEMLDTFGLQQGGTQYRRLLASFQRVFGATIFFGTDVQRERALVIEQGRFNFMTEARIWFTRDSQQECLPGGFQNTVVLSPEFYAEITSHKIPTDLDAVRALSGCPAALDLFMWLTYRCYTARAASAVPLYGAFGLVNQLGSAEYARPRKFRERLQLWLEQIRRMWPECPARISGDGLNLPKDI